MFESSDDSEEESAPKPTLGELLGRLREEQQQINPVPNPTLLMPMEQTTATGVQTPKESSPDTVISSM